MAEAVVAAPVAESKGPGLMARLIGVIFSPRATYQAVVARPRVLGAFVITIALMAVTEGVFFSTPVMQEVLVVRKQLRLIEELHIRKTRTERREPRTILLRKEEATVERLEDSREP